MPRSISISSEAELSAVIAGEAAAIGSQVRYVRANMVTSLDGAYAISGTSGALGDEVDRWMLGGLRAISDVIVVGAATARAERYRRPLIPIAPWSEVRQSLGFGASPRLCIVTRSAANLDWERLAPTRDRDDSPILIASPEPVPRFLAAEHIPISSGVAAASELTQALERRGYSRILCEGGPTLLGQFRQSGLINELNVTISLIAAGQALTTPVFGFSQYPEAWHLSRVIVGERTLLCRLLNPHTAPLE